MGWLRRIFEHSNDAILILDPDRDRIVDVNQAACQMLGYSKQELLDLPISGVHPAEMEKFTSFYETMGPGGHGWTDELTCMTKDGERLPSEISASVAEFEDRPHMVAMVRDISERVKAEQELVESERRYRDLFQSAFDVVFMVDEAGEIIDINRRAEELTGYERDQLLEFNLFEDLILPEDEPVMEALKDQLTRGKEMLYEVRWQAKDGNVIHFEGASTSRRTPDGEFVSTRCTLRDITERKRAEKNSELQLRRMQALRSIDLAISGSLDLRVILDVLIEQVMAQLDVDAANVLLLNPATQFLDFGAGRGFRTDALRNTHLRIGDGSAGRAALNREIVQIPVLAETEGELARPLLTEVENFVTYIAVPLEARGEVKGVMETFHRQYFEPDDEWMRFLEALGTQAAIAINSAELFEDLQRSNTELILTYDITLEGWAKALELRDRETVGHTRRVTDMTLRLAREMGIKQEDQAHIRRGALLHDIGKMGIPDQILFKEGSLSDDEWEIMRKHPIYAYDLLSKIPFLRPALDIPYCHHEKWDGSGYPRGLHGEDIPLAARIFSVVDVYDALLSPRPYREAWSKNRVIEYLQDQSGKHFDPEIIPVFLEVFQR